jgi:peptidyl-prolyl cis-trans isomerase SurA
LEEGNITEPFRSRFGWHIAKLYDRRGMQPIDSVYSTIMKSVQRDERVTFADKSFIEKTRAEYNLPADMTDEAVRSYADAHLEEKYEELRYLVNEYHDGILLFEVSLQKVWDKASKDDAGLTKFFRKNKKNYTWDAPRYKGYMIYAKNPSVANQVKSIIKNAHPDSIQSYINNRINNDSTTLVRVERGLWQEGQNAAVDYVVFKNDTVNFTADEALPFVTTMGKVIKAPQEYADERGKVTNDYQDALEKEWIESLRTKYDWHVNQEVFDALKAKYE